MQPRLCRECGPRGPNRHGAVQLHRIRVKELRPGFQEIPPVRILSLPDEKRTSKYPNGTNAVRIQYWVLALHRLDLRLPASEIRICGQHTSEARMLRRH